MGFRVMEIQGTPNPNALKFVLDRRISERTVSFFSSDQAKDHPLAAQLFAINGVTGVMLLGDFVTVSKRPEAKWPQISGRVEWVLAEG